MPSRNPVQNATETGSTRLLHWFDFVSAHPRPSGGEAPLVAAIRAKAANWGLDHDIDAYGNLLIRKPSQGTGGAGPVIILQAHLDMVAVSERPDHSPAVHPVRPLQRDGWLMAEGSSLGADNGLGVAAILAILESTDLPHGALEALFTVEEETGLKGAKALQPGWLRGQNLINLDAEDDRLLVVGAAGGLPARIAADFDVSTPEPDWVAVSCELDGLPGGHSGLDIDKGRPNAICSLASWLSRTAGDTPLRLIAFQGGTGRNAIPAAAKAIVAVPPESPLARLPRAPLGPALDPGPTRSILQSLETFAAPVLEATAEGSPATSLNLGRLSLKDGHLNAEALGRFLHPVGLALLRDRLAGAWQDLSVTLDTDTPHAAWTPQSDSPLRDRATNLFRMVLGQAPRITSLHAGLECAAILAHYPTLDAISIGPCIEGAHSTAERANLASIERFWRLLVALIAPATVS